MTARVIIIGGGIAGLSAAHELVRRGFEVDVYEAEFRPGGKARSFPGPDFGGPGSGLPAEHGFRFFPGFYKHIVLTMGEIPVFGTGKTVAENLVDLPVISIASFDHDIIGIPAKFSVTSLMNSLQGAFATANVTFEPGEIKYYAERIWQILTSSRERRVGEYEKIGWWDYIDADARSLNYRKYLANLPRLLVAADPRRVSTKTNGDVVVQLYLDAFRAGAVDRILNGPTNEAWLYPWIKDLVDRGVRVFLNAKVGRLKVLDERVHAIEVDRADGVSDILRVVDCTVTGPQTIDFAPGLIETGSADDYYISAVPVEVMRDFVRDPVSNTWTDLANADVTLRDIVPLSESVDWMSGIMFYLKSNAPSIEGHTIYVDPFRENVGDDQYAVTSIFQKQYWPGVDLSTYANGQAADILSVDVSDWENLKQGVPLADVPNRIWDVIKQSFQNTASPVGDVHLLGTFVDPAIGEDFGGGLVKLTNKTPLLVNLVDTWHLRPHAYTGVENLMLAADYVKTHTDLATMEGANEAARYAVNSILEKEGRSDLAKTWKLHEPALFLIYRWLDKRRYRKGLPWRDHMPWFLKVVDWIWQFFVKLFT